MKPCDARLDLLERWGREACKQRKVAYQPGVEADPAALVPEFAPQPRCTEEALMIGDQGGRRAHGKWKLGTTAFANGACPVQGSHEFEDGARVFGEAKLRRKALPEGCRAHGCSSLRQLLEQLDSTLRNAAQGSISYRQSGARRVARLRGVWQTTARDRR